MSWRAGEAHMNGDCGPGCVACEIEDEQVFPPEQTVGNPTTAYHCSGRDGARLDTCPGHTRFGEDCPAWDAHMAHAGAHFEKLAPGQYGVAPDGENEPSLWRGAPNGLPMQVLRRCDLAANHRDAWDDIVGALVGGAR